MSFNRVEANNEARERYIQQMMQTYNNREKKLEGRKIEFFKKNKNAELELIVLVGGGTLSGAIAGGVVGAVVGGACGTPGGPPGMALGAAIGAPVGALVGAAIGAGIAVVVLRPRYQKWCKTEAGKEFAGKMHIFLHENTILEHLMCPITDMPVIEGVRTPDGQLYEKSEIEKWVKEHGTNPKTREQITLDDLTPDETASLESAKTFVKFLQEKRTETKSIASDLMPGYDKLIQDTREAAMDVHNNKLVTLQKQWQKGKISYEDFSVKSRALGEKYLNI